MSIRHGRSWHWRTLRSRAEARCARCGRSIQRGASASEYYGSAGRVGSMVMVRMSGDSCGCAQPDPIVAQPTEVATG